MDSTETLGEVTIKGTKADIGAELTCLMKGLIEGEIMTDDEIVQALAVATMSESEKKMLLRRLCRIFSLNFLRRTSDGK